MSGLFEPIVQGAVPRPPITWLHRAEFCNAVELHVYWGRQGGLPRVTPEQAAVAHSLFSDDLRWEVLFEEATLESDDLNIQLETLSLRHSARHGFRTYDLMHVASALLLGCDTFWSFDAKAVRLAKLEGLAAT